MSEATRPAVLTGGCQCGAVRYALYAEPDVGICHCRMCQKATGGLFLASAGVPLAQFAWTKGEPAVFQSSSVAERGYLPRLRHAALLPLPRQGHDRRHHR